MTKGVFQCDRPPRGETGFENLLTIFKNNACPARAGKATVMETSLNAPVHLVCKFSKTYIIVI